MRGLLGVFMIALIGVAIAAPVSAQTEPPASVGDPYLPWRAQMEAERPPPRERTPVRRWYGWQTLAVDAISIGFISVAAVLDAPPAVWTGLGIWWIAAPIAHLGNSNTGSAAISFGMRSGALLLAGGGLVLFLRDALDDSDSGGDGGVEVGAALFIAGFTGMIASIAIDASLLAFGEPVQQRAPELAIVPWVDLDRVQGVRVALTF